MPLVRPGFLWDAVPLVRSRFLFPLSGEAPHWMLVSRSVPSGWGPVSSVATRCGRLPRSLFYLHPDALQLFHSKYSRFFRIDAAAGDDDETSDCWDSLPQLSY